MPLFTRLPSQRNSLILQGMRARRSERGRKGVNGTTMHDGDRQFLDDTGMGRSVAIRETNPAESQCRDHEE
jgi:hypothetical protein